MGLVSNVSIILDSLLNKRSHPIDNVVTCSGEFMKKVHACLSPYSRWPNVYGKRDFLKNKNKIPGSFDFLSFRPLKRRNKRPYEYIYILRTRVLHNGIEPGHSGADAIRWADPIANFTGCETYTKSASEWGLSIDQCNNGFKLFLPFLACSQMAGRGLLSIKNSRAFR